MYNEILNRGQGFTVDESMKFFADPYQQLFQIDGEAGTGKSTVLKHIIARNRIPLERILAMSYTGAAAVILKLSGFPNAKTLHSGLYHPVDTYMTDKQTNQIIYNTYYNRPKTTTGFTPKIKSNFDNIDLMIIDEAPTVPMSMRKDIMKHGIKVIASGDLFQLPPLFEKPAFLTDGVVHHLTEPMRQGTNSNILYLARRARRGLPINYGYYGDCYVTDEDDLTDTMIMRSDIVICGTNKKRDEINKRVREIKGTCNSELPLRGERVVCRKNNYKTVIDGINLANGLIGTVMNNPGVDNYDNNTFKIDFQPLLFPGIFSDLRCDYKYFMAPYSEKEKIKQDKYSLGEKFEFSYASTCHLAQGASLANGIYIEEYMSPELNDRLNYVGISRFRQGMIYIKRKIRLYNCGSWDRG